MNNKIETLLSMGTGGVLAAIKSYQTFDYLTEVAARGILAILTGFLGAFAGLFAKVLFNHLRDKYFPDYGGKRK